MTSHDKGTQQSQPLPLKGVCAAVTISLLITACGASSPLQSPSPTPMPRVTPPINLVGSYSLTITPSRFCAPYYSGVNEADFPETVQLTLRQTGTAVSTHEVLRDFGNNVRVDLEGTVGGSSVTVAALSVVHHNKFNNWSFVLGTGTGAIDGQMITGSMSGRFQRYGAEGNLERFGRVLFDCTASDHTFQLSPASP